MAIRALLLSADPQAVPAVIQVLKELDLAFEHCKEPSAGLDSLANQHFDAILIDCDNQQDAVPVFEHVRGSAANKSAITIAIVEGKTGVPNAFHLGATLVLTKPVALEQARSTLRTALSMLRKEAQAGKAIVTSAAAAGQGIGVSRSAFRSLGVREKPAHPAQETAKPTSSPQLPMLEAPSLAAEPGAGGSPSDPKVATVGTKIGHAQTEELHPDLAPSHKAISEVAAKADIAAVIMASPNNVAPLDEDAVLAELEEKSKIAVTPRTSARASRTPNRTPLLAAVVVVLVVAVAYAAWGTVPQFRALVTSAYQKIQLKITGFETRQQVAIAPAQSAAQPVRAAATQSAVSSAAQTSQTPGITPPGTETAAQTADSTAPSGSVSLQNLKQDSTANTTVTLVATSSTSRKGTAPSNEPVMLPEDAADADLVHKVSPGYPEEAKQKKVQGTVVLQAMVDKDGNVDFVKVVNGNDLLISAAVDAVRQWRYKPYVQNGEPVSFVTQVTVDFRLP